MGKLKFFYCLIKDSILQTTTAPPKKPEEISANWKALQQVLQKENGSSKKKKKKFLPLKKEKAMPTTTKPVEKESEAEKPAKPEIWFEIDDENLLEHSLSNDLQ